MAYKGGSMSDRVYVFDYCEICCGEHHGPAHHLVAGQDSHDKFPESFRSIDD